MTKRERLEHAVGYEDAFSKLPLESKLEIFSYLQVREAIATASWSHSFQLPTRVKPRMDEISLTHKDGLDLNHPSANRNLTEARFDAACRGLSKWTQRTRVLHLPNLACSMQLLSSPFVRFPALQCLQIMPSSESEHSFKWVLGRKQWSHLLTSCPQLHSILFVRMFSNMSAADWAMPSASEHSWQCVRIESDNFGVGLEEWKVFLNPALCAIDVPCADVDLPLLDAMAKGAPNLNRIRLHRTHCRRLDEDDVLLLCVAHRWPKLTDVRLSFGDGSASLVLHESTALHLYTKWSWLHSFPSNTAFEIPNIEFSAKSIAAAFPPNQLQHLTLFGRDEAWTRLTDWLLMLRTSTQWKSLHLELNERHSVVPEAVLLEIFTHYPLLEHVCVTNEVQCSATLLNAICHRGRLCKRIELGCSDDYVTVPRSTTLTTQDLLACIVSPSVEELVLATSVSADVDFVRLRAAVASCSRRKEISLFDCTNNYMLLKTPLF